MLTPEQIEEFQQAGILRIPGLLGKRDVEAMRNRVWDALEHEFPMQREDSSTWNALKTIGRQRIAGLNALPKTERFPEIGKPETRSLADQLLGAAKWKTPERWASLLVTFPNSTAPWELPYQSWHFDYPATPALRGLWALRIFTCLAPLLAGSGATLVVAGSHRLVEKLAARTGATCSHSAETKRALIRSYPWFQALCGKGEQLDRVRRFMSSPSTVDSVEVRVIELCGEPGDAWLMHPWAMHNGSPNCASAPRIVLNTTVYRNGALADLFLPGAKESAVALTS